MKIFSSYFPFWLFVFFALGIVLAYFSPLLGMFVVGVLAAGGAVWFFYKKQNLLFSDICILALFICLGAAWAIPAIKQNREIDNIVGAHGNVPLQIKIVTIPQGKSVRNTCYAIVKPFNRRVKVMDYTRQLKYLHSYAVAGKISRRNYQGQPFYTLWIKKDVGAHGNVPLPLSFWDKCVIGTTNYIMAVFKNNLTDKAYCFMASVFLGRRELLGGMKNIVTDAGVSHLLAISGLHIALTAMVLFFILRLFYIKFRARLIISLIFLFLYTMLTGPSSSTLRAVIMYSVFVLGFFFQRRINLFNSLGIAGLISLMIKPLAIFEAGFQLSFLSVFAIILGVRIFEIRGSSNRVISYAKQILFCSLIVSVFLTPLVSYYFGRIYFLPVLYNIVLIPFFTGILIINFILIIFAPFISIAQAIGEVLSLVVKGFIEFSRILGGIKGTFISYSFSMRGVILYYLMVTAFVGIKNQFFRDRQNSSR